MRAQSLLFALLLTVFASGCSDTTSPGGFSSRDVDDAMSRGIVLPGMTPKQVSFVWGSPKQRRTAEKGEQWLYDPDVPATGPGYHPVVTVTFIEGKVDSVVNGDLKGKRDSMQAFDGLTRRIPHGAFDSTGSSSSGFFGR